MALKGSNRLGAALSCLATWLLTSAARSAPLTATITVERDARASDCPDRYALTRNVERILQRPFSTTDATRDQALQVAVHFALEHEDYSAEVRSLGPKPGERRLRDHGRSCAALAEAVSVAIALLLDKELERRSAQTAATLAPAASGTPAEAAPKPRATPAEAAAQFELRALFEAGFASGLSGSRAPLLGEMLGVRIHEQFLIEAAFNAALPATTDFGAGQVRSTLLFGSLRACYTWGARYSLGPCALLGVGRLRGVGLGYASVQSESLPWVALGAGLLAEGPVWGRVFCGLSGVAWLPTRRSAFSVENAGTAWESSPFGVSASARLGFRIW